MLRSSKSQYLYLLYNNIGDDALAHLKGIDRLEPSNSAAT